MCRLLNVQTPETFGCLHECYCVKLWNTGLKSENQNDVILTFEVMIRLGK